MMNSTLILSLFCIFNWISVSVCQFHTVVIQSGEEVTLQCSNHSSVFSRIWWFKLGNGPNVSYISSMQRFGSNASFYDGFQQSKFTMTSNFSNIFLNIKELGVNDSGIYFCGINTKGVPGVFTATHLQVEVVISDQFNGSNNLPNWILGGAVIFLSMVIIGLFVKIRTLLTAQTDVKNVQLHENIDSCTLNYATVGFIPKAKGNRRSTKEREIESSVLYAATK